MSANNQIVVVRTKEEYYNIHYNRCVDNKFIIENLTPLNEDVMKKEKKRKFLKMNMIKKLEELEEDIKKLKGE